MSYIPQLLASLETRLDELTTEIGALEGARAALEAPAPATPSAVVAKNGGRQKQRRQPTARTRKAPAPQPAPTPAADRETEPGAAVEADTKPTVQRSPRPVAAKATRQKRATVSLRAEDLERLLGTAVSGLSAGAVAEQAGAGYSRVLAQLRELETSGQVRRTGTRRSTLWRLVTDEERIAERAAELEARARRAGPSRRRGRARAS